MNMPARSVAAKMVMNSNRYPLAESVAAAVCGYAAAALVEAVLIRWLRATEWELAWVSDAVLAAVLGAVVYLWRRLGNTRAELKARDRAELVLQTQLSVAAEIQHRLLPRVPPTESHFEWAAMLRSAGTIGGDFYDFVEVTPGVWMILLADVSGKGIPAAMALGSLRSAFRALVRESSSPARIVAQLSAILYEQWNAALYVTCIVGLLDADTRTLTYTNGGHPPGIIAGRGGVRRLTRGGPPAGLLPVAHYDQERITLQPADACVLITDGISESREDDMPLDHYLRGILGRDNRASAGEVCQAVMARSLAGHGPAGVADWNDDRTVVVVKVCGSMTAPAAAEENRRSPTAR